jgi:hypothetical protein
VTLACRAILFSVERFQFDFHALRPTWQVASAEWLNEETARIAARRFSSIKSGGSSAGSSHRALRHHLD